MKKILAAAATLLVVLALAGCEGNWNNFFYVKANSVTADSQKSKDETLENTVTQKTGEDEMNPIVTIEMENGMIISLELCPDKAPNTVNNFISLVEDGFYDGLTFHRIIDGFMIQGGCPEGTGMGGPGYQIPGEFKSNGYKENDIKHTAGVISMARSMNMDSAGSQFFIMVGSSPHLDGAYAAFGKVVDEESLNNCLELAMVKVSGDRPVDPPVIKSITVDTKGVDYGLPNHS